MSVINTNITSMIAQKNLNASKNSLTTAMERLSSGMRINSAKDDAAGQAIANRMTSQIKGLAQAQRNANDGISVTQTAEGALNQINDNLQRIRELSVQAANGTNSGEDLISIQNEIGQRLDEINRVSKETNFNGTKVLNENQTLNIQVGANDSEVIKVDLKSINASTLGLSSFDITQSSVSSSKLSSAIISAGEVDKTVTATIKANSFTPTPGPAATFDAAFNKKDGSGIVARAEDGNYYDLTRNEVTDTWTWDSSKTAVSAADVDTSTEVTDLPIKIVGNIGTLNATGTAPKLADGTTDFSVEPTALYLRNDATGESYAVKGNDENYYAATLTIDSTDPNKANWTYTVNIDYGNLTQVSDSNVNIAAAAQITGKTEAIGTNANIYGIEVNPSDAPTAASLHEYEGGYAVKASDGNYYTATVNTSGEVSWDSSTPALDASKANATATTTVKTGDKVSVNLSGLASGETLHEILDADGNGTGSFIIKGTDGNENTTYNTATVAADGVVTKNADAVMVDPLKALDNALAKVDNLRSDLGAIQNRFESAITNLGTNETNLSAARSRIEDADYAKEVANMTRAQILQQAGTSVLAQANQVPQGVLSLLR